VIDLKVSTKHVSEARAARDPQATLYRLAKRAEGAARGRFLFHSVRRGPIRSGGALPGRAGRAQRRATAGDRGAGRADGEGDRPLRRVGRLAAIEPRRLVVRTRPVPGLARVPGRGRRGLTEARLAGGPNVPYERGPGGEHRRPGTWKGMQAISSRGHRVAQVVYGDLAVLHPASVAPGADDPLSRFVAAMDRFAMEIDRGLIPGG
jgi:hypothetical protein